MRKPIDSRVARLEKKQADDERGVRIVGYMVAIGVIIYLLGQLA